MLDSAKRSGKGRQLAVTALLFSQTEVFQAPIPIARSRQLCDSMNKAGFFQTTQSVDEEVVRRFYEEGMRRDDD